MKRFLLNLLSIVWLFVYPSLSSYAQRQSVKLDLSSAESKYKLHFTSKTKVVTTKKDVYSINYSGGWFFVNFKSHVDIYDSSFTLCYSEQECDTWRLPRVDNDITVIGNGEIFNLRENKIVGQLGNYMSYSALTDGVGWVKRDSTDKSGFGSHLYIYELFTISGKPLGDSTRIITTRYYDVKKPSPLVDGRRAIYIHDLDRWCYLDETGNLVIGPEYIKAHDFSEGLAAVKKEADDEYKWGFINPRGDEVIPFKFTKEPEDFHDGVAVVTKMNGKKTFLLKDGTTAKADVDFLLPRWKNHVVLGYLNPTYTRILTPTKDVMIDTYSYTPKDFDEYGNWVSRMDNEEKVTRTITYWPDPYDIGEQPHYKSAVAVAKAIYKAKKDKVPVAYLGTYEYETRAFLSYDIRLC